MRQDIAQLIDLEIRRQFTIHKDRAIGSPTLSDEMRIIILMEEVREDHQLD